jgi:outer membrane protein TolC
MMGRASDLAEAEEALAQLEGDLQRLETALRAFTGSSSGF